VNDDFFIGYLPRIPAGTHKVLKRTIIGLFVFAVSLSALLVFGQSRLAPAFFEFTKATEFTGTLEEHPYPTLQDAKPQSTGESTYLLVAPGKFGAEAIFAGFEGARVRLKGKKIYRDRLAMIEVVPGSIQTIAATAPSLAAPVVGEELTLTGEIVDSKCYYGVMNPGQGKVHRDCAARCLSGGIPPSFVVQSGELNGTVYLLTNESGGALRKNTFLDNVGRPVKIRGRIVIRGEQQELRAASISVAR
jgi:hypothetical protein